MIDKCRSHNLRKKLLEASGTLTLQKEAAESQARLIENDSKGDNAHALEDNQANYGTRKRGNSYRCGLEGHFARDPECKVRSVTCQKCKRTGHLTKFCRTKGEDKTKKGNVRHVTEDDDFAFTVQLGARDIPTVAIELEGVHLKGVLFDSGSTCNVIDKETWEVLKKKKIKCKSWKSNKKLYSYGSEESLNTAGEFEAELRYKDRQGAARFVVVEEKANTQLTDL